MTVSHVACSLGMLGQYYAVMTVFKSTISVTLINLALIIVCESPLAAPMLIGQP